MSCKTQYGHVFSVGSRVAIVLLLSASTFVKAQPVVTTPVESTTTVHVAPNVASTEGLGLSIGVNTDYRRLALTYETPHFWEHRLPAGWGSLRLSAEFGAAYWKARHVSTESMGQLTAALMMKWWTTDRFYIELGSGPTLLSKSEFANRRLSTHFQFGSNLGLGFLLNKRHRIGVRYSHYSNANIKKPNQGLDVLSLVYDFQF